ncbi:hypothetical protein U9R62_13420 [Cylindrospermopsis raciborskii DSH]
MSSLNARIIPEDITNYHGHNCHPADHIYVMEIKVVDAGENVKENRA